MTKIIQRPYDSVAPEDKPHMVFNTWYPDTCGCIHEFFWDRRTNEDNREHHPHQSKKVCEHHSHHARAVTTIEKGIGDNDHVFEHHMEVQEENWHKCRSIAHVLECLGDDHKTFEKNDDGTIVPWFKRVPDWSFEYKTSNKFRDLHLKVHNATEDDKSKIAEVLKINYPNRTVHLK